MSLGRTIGFYGTPPVLLGLAYAAYRFWFAGVSAPSGESTSSPPAPVPPPIERAVDDPVGNMPGGPVSARMPVEGSAAADAAGLETAAPPPSAAAVRLSTIAQAEALLPELAAEISTRSEWLLWARMSGILSRFVSAIDCVANGTSPRRHVAFLGPGRPFTAARAGGDWVMAPASTARYDRIVDLACSLDSAACGRVFQRLEPVLEQVYRRLGYQDGGFRDAVAAAAAELCSVPVSSHPVRLVRRGAVFEYRDSRLAELSEAQKHLLRAGPANARRIQAKIRELAAAAGIEVR